jgi:hypothetical protein
MSTRRAVTVVAVILFAAPSPAAAAPTITADLPCYTPGMAQHITGSGFTPGGPVMLGMIVEIGPLYENLGGFTIAADAAGAIDVQIEMPEFLAERGTGQIIAIDSTLDAQGVPDEQSSFVLPIDVSHWDINIQRWGGSTARGKPGRRTKVDTIGWIGTASTTLYAHYLRGSKLVKTMRVGALTGNCADFAGRMKEFPFRRVKAGNYRVVFDTTRAYPNDDANIAFRRVKVARGTTISATAALADPVERLRRPASGPMFAYRR